LGFFGFFTCGSGEADVDGVSSSAGAASASSDIPATLDTSG